MFPKTPVDCSCGYFLSDEPIPVGLQQHVLLQHVVASQQIVLRWFSHLLVTLRRNKLWSSFLTTPVFTEQKVLQLDVRVYQIFCMTTRKCATNKTKLCKVDEQIQQCQLAGARFLHFFSANPDCVAKNGGLNHRAVRSHSAFEKPMKMSDVRMGGCTISACFNHRVCGH